jgi:hypothetical protein
VTLYSVVEAVHAWHGWHGPLGPVLKVASALIAVGSAFMLLVHPFAPPAEDALQVLPVVATVGIGIVAGWAVARIPKKLSRTWRWSLCIAVPVAVVAGAVMLFIYERYLDQHVDHEVGGKPFVYGDVYPEVEADRRGRRISELVYERGELADVRHHATLWSVESENHARRRLELLYSVGCLLLGGALVVVAVYLFKLRKPIATEPGSRPPTPLSSG